MTPRFEGRVSGGKVLLSDLEKYEQWVSGLEGKDVEVVVKKKKSERTLNQNRYLWAVVYQIIGDYIGDSNEEIHSLMKSIFLKDHKEVGNKRYTVIKSTTDLSTDEFSTYIEDIKRWASKELGLFIPEANQVKY